VTTVGINFQKAVVRSHGFAFSPRVFFARGLLFNVSPLGKGVGTPGTRCTRSLVGRKNSHTSKFTTDTPKQPGAPHAMVYSCSPVIGLC
jgi:hypothetical protein